MEALQDEGSRPWLAWQRGWVHLLMGESPASVRAEMLQDGSLHHKVTERGRNLSGRARSAGEPAGGR